MSRQKLGLGALSLAKLRNGTLPPTAGSAQASKDMQIGGKYSGGKEFKEWGKLQGAERA